MSTYRKIQNLRARGYLFRVDGDRLRYGGPPTAKAETEHAWFAENKARLVQALNAEAELTRGIPLPLGWTPEVERQWGDIVYTLRPTRAEYARRIGLVAHPGAKQEHFDPLGAVAEAFGEAKLMDIVLDGKAQRGESPQKVS